MKAILSFVFLVSLVGCVSGQPSSFERALYQVTTNYVTNVVGVAQVNPTNNVVTNVMYVTNVVMAFELHPKESVQAAINTGTVAGGAVATGLGAPWVVPLLSLLGGLYAWWAEFRNSQKKKLNVSSVQSLETAGEMFKAQPGGEDLAAKFKAEVVSQQVQSGSKKIAAKVVEDNVDPVAAKASADRVLKA